MLELQDCKLPSYSAHPDIWWGEFDKQRKATHCSFSSFENGAITAKRRSFYSWQYDYAHQRLPEGYHLPPTPTTGSSLQSTMTCSRGACLPAAAPLRCIPSFAGSRGSACATPTTDWLVHEDPEEHLERAKSILDSMAVVGLTEYYNESICVMAFKFWSDGLLSQGVYLQCRGIPPSEQRSRGLSVTL